MTTPGKFKKIMIWIAIGATGLAFIALVLFAPKASASLNKLMKMLMGKLDIREQAADAGVASSNQAAAQIENTIHTSEDAIHTTEQQLTKPDVVSGAEEASDFLHNLGK